MCNYYFVLIFCYLVSILEIRNEIIVVNGYSLKIENFKLDVRKKFLVGIFSFLIGDIVVCIIFRLDFIILRLFIFNFV